ncbi:MAG: NADH-quinone oxidoreductase subunit N [Thermoanaerobaculia bacterium]|nr:NADH-quinone oxidoreductase subunit N [Thermoanaerobaculia bacterium]
MNLSSATMMSDLASVAPEVFLMVTGILVLLLGALLPRLSRLWIPLSSAAVVGAGWLVFTQMDQVGTSFGGFLEWSPVTAAGSQVVLLSGLLALLASQSYLRRERLLTAEYAALILWCMVGLLLLLRSTELLTLFVALELLSFCLYALAAYHRRYAVSIEAGVKYFLMGAFVSAFVLLGIALLYGETGSTRIDPVGAALARGQGSGLLVTLGVLLLVCGFGFKLSVVPFHTWAPDAYQGAPSPFVAFFSVAPKAASALVVFRVLLELGAPMVETNWTGLVSFLAIASIVVGNLLALVQKDIKRMLAYSGVAHMGYLLIPLASTDMDSLPPLLVYLLAYALMNAGAFVVVGFLYGRPGEQHLISEISGWGYRFPYLALGLTVFMLSLGGLPPTLGFLGKYLVFAHAIQHGHWLLALVGIAGSLVGIFYYLRVVYVLYMKDEVLEPSGLRFDLWGNLSVGLAIAGTLLLGIFPARVLSWLQQAILY